MALYAMRILIWRKRDFDNACEGGNMGEINTWDVMIWFHVLGQ